MERLSFSELGDKIKNTADSQAKALARGKANFEDDLSVAMELYKGLLVQGDEKSKTLKDEIEVKLAEFIENILTAEREFFAKKDEGNALSYLKSFIISFASRTASRERLQIFTTNYDRFIEYACDKAGVLILDRFIGKISPVFRTNKLELDYHYNPPGIRGEPRYVEGVIKYTKLHGSLDWRFSEEEIIKSSLPFGADNDHPDVLEEPFEHVVIYPNSSKGIETVFYPYSELFRDLSSAICRPNSVVVTYGYGFGDSHVNRILKDMLTIPSTHLVIISWDIADNRIQKFVEQNNQSQFTLLIGNHFGNLKTLVENYLPKAAIDKISEREQRYREKTGRDNPDSFGKIEL
ncbi:MAG: SIR2 family protein [Promethearchaeota archaeon]